MQAVADVIRTTLGPRSMLKMLLDASGGTFLVMEAMLCFFYADSRESGEIFLENCLHAVFELDEVRMKVFIVVFWFSWQELSSQTMETQF